MQPEHTEAIDSRQAEFKSLAACLRFCSNILRYPEPAIHVALDQALPAFEGLHHVLLKCKQAALPDIESMQVSYTSLFVANPAGLPAVPYVSCRLEPDGQVYGAATHALRTMMAAEGVRLDSGVGEPEDHFGLVFDFAALLAERAVVNTEKTGVLKYLIDTYLSPLLPGFAADVAKAEPDGFYADATAFCSVFRVKLDGLLPSIVVKSEY